MSACTTTTINSCYWCYCCLCTSRFFRQCVSLECGFCGCWTLVQVMRARAHDPSFSLFLSLNTSRTTMPIFFICPFFVDEYHDDDDDEDDDGWDECILFNISHAKKETLSLFFFFLGELVIILLEYIYKMKIEQMLYLDMSRFIYIAHHQPCLCQNKIIMDHLNPEKLKNFRFFIKFMYTLCLFFFIIYFFLSIPFFPFSILSFFWGFILFIFI